MIASHLLGQSMQLDMQLSTCGRHHIHQTAGADVERVKREIEEVIGIDCSHAICASAKQVPRCTNRSSNSALPSALPLLCVIPWKAHMRVGLGSK